LRRAATPDPHLSSSFPELPRFGAATDAHHAINMIPQSMKRAPAAPIARRRFSTALSSSLSAFADRLGVRAQNPVDVSAAHRR
jgi:hypothetical protein